MKLWLLSDLHLETVPFPTAFNPKRPDFDVLLSAGDTWQGNIAGGFQFLRGLAGRKPIVAVLGNHEHFRGELNQNLAAARQAAKKFGVTLLEGDAVELDGCRFIGATLWSDYQLGGDVDPASLTGETIEVRDEAGARAFAVADARRLHAEAVASLRSHLNAASPLPTVVVTHHAPLADCLPPPIRGKWIAGNSASDLSDLTDAGTVTLWVHGHIHASIDIQRSSGARVVCNPAGSLFSNTRFVEDLVLTVGR